MIFYKYSTKQNIKTRARVYIITHYKAARQIHHTHTHTHSGRMNNEQ
jgi:hypothetical protein